ncbi:metal ABC transporter substrate-binding protein [Anabaena sp. UHCC 0187]|uniref:metal ABC transporter solute-binding protein, Zn/Mn family n=1 Tax=Anabaena sp. UHCC 0187 TaxID=2590018 RepID=UPI0014468476|nr:zinc ABC transporter substrate-binding protein [Anabaena sp. UHCC 0187]MTJ14648.1 metal ABC transporter substrate-binding protein [Anabaena sp. UHCC 0187]
MLERKLSTHLFKTTILGLVLGLFGCGNKTMSTTYNLSNKTINNNLPVVVATNSIICDLTKQVAGNTINLICLIPPGINPINYKPIPEDIQTIENANLVLYHGYNFEPGLIKIIKTIKNSQPKIAVAQLAVINTVKVKQNRKQITEPHVWHNPKNTIKMVEIINSNLIKLAPKNKNTYTKNSKKITREINQINSWIKVRLASIPAKNWQLITANEAMIYYVKAYDMPYTGSLANIKNIEKLTDTKVKNLARDIQKSKVPTIFADTITNSNLLAPIAKEAKVKVFQRPLYIDGLGEAGSDGETYQKMMAANTRIIVEGLGGTYLKFEPK